MEAAGLVCEEATETCRGFLRSVVSGVLLAEADLHVVVPIGGEVTAGVPVRRVAGDELARGVAARSLHVFRLLRILMASEHWAIRSLSPACSSWLAEVASGWSVANIWPYSSIVARRMASS